MPWQILENFAKHFPPFPINIEVVPVHEMVTFGAGFSPSHLRSCRKTPQMRGTLGGRCLGMVQGEKDINEEAPMP